MKEGAVGTAAAKDLTKLGYLYRAELEQILPHRDRALKIDNVRILHDEEGRVAEIRAFKEISSLDSDLRGHFERKLVYPGHCLVECAALASAVLGFLLVGGEGVPLFAAIGPTRFKTPVLPGDEIRIMPTLLRRKGPIFIFEVKIYNQHDKLAVNTEITGALAKIEEL